MEIREYKSKDYQQVVELWLRCGIELNQSDTLEELDKGQRHNPGLFLVAEDDRRICGVALGFFNGRRGWVNHLAVSIEYRGRGLGKQLLAALEERLVKLGCPRLNLHILPESAGLQHYYAKLGYVRQDVIYMYKLL